MSVASRSSPLIVRRAVWKACLVVVALAACGRSQLGPCEVVYKDPLLTIASARNRVTLQAVPIVTLQEISFAGSPVRDLRFLTQTGGPVGGVIAAGTNLTCTITCFFAASEGRYSMRVSAPGYRDTTVTIDGGYATRERVNGGCPLRLSKGVSIDLSLSPQ